MISKRVVEFQDAVAAWKKNNPDSTPFAYALEKVLKQILEYVKKERKATYAAFLLELADGKFDELFVIRTILDIAGKYHIPSTYPKIKKKELATNLDYTEQLLSILQIELNAYIKRLKPDASFSDADLGDCETVGDVLESLEEKLK